MSSTSPRRRPSTLAADRFRATQQPLGASLGASPSAPLVSSRPGTVSETERLTGGRSLYATVATGAAAPRAIGAASARPAPVARPEGWRPAAPSTPTPRGGVAAAAAPATAARSERESVFVTSVVVAFLFLTLAVAGVKVRGTMQADRSRTDIAGSLSRAYEQQTAFRLLNQRFATWPELEARGMSLPDRQRVVASNASQSHWFLSVRDTATGIVCSRTGELFDDSPFDRQPSCSASPR